MNGIIPIIAAIGGLLGFVYTSFAYTGAIPVPGWDDWFPMHPTDPV